MATRTAPLVNGNGTKNGEAFASTVERETVVMDLEISRPSFRRRMASEDVMAADDTADRSMLHISKDLLDKKVMEAISSEEGALKRWLRTRDIPCSVLRGGMYLMPLALVLEVDKRIAEFTASRKRLVKDDLVGKYEEHIQAAEARLGKHFDRSEYPDPDTLVGAFAVKARWLSFNVPAALKGINKALYERERQRVEADWAEAADDVRGALRESFAGLVEKLAERLGSDEGGKPKTFRDNTIDKLRDFLATFAARDLTRDGELMALATQAKEILGGVQPDQLRKQELVRGRVKAGFDEIKAKLDVLVPVTKTRRFAADGDV